MMIPLVWLAVASCSSLPTFASPALGKRAAIDDCLKTAKVPVYASAVKPFNIRLPFKPAAYAVPSTVQHVQDAVSCGVKNSVKVTAKSGGHSYGAHGLGGEDGHLVLDMRQFKSVTVDQKAHTAVVGSGGRLGNIATALYNQGKQAMSHGTCPGVGVGGLTLHGGYGLISRLKGLTLDNLISAQVVLHNSTVVTASATENAELFWSLRGAGAAFGIVTTFTFKTFDAPENNINFEYIMASQNAAQLANQLSILQDFSKTTQPPELNMRLFVGQNQLLGVYYGSRTEFDKVMSPLLKKLGITASGTISTKGWLDTLTNYAYGQLQQPDVYTYQENFFAKSLMPDTLSSKALQALSDYYYNTARYVGRSWYLLIDLHGGAQSAISKVPAGNTAYAHRNATFKIQFNDRIFPDTATYQQSMQSFLNGWVSAIEAGDPGVTHGMYINYADTSLSKDQAHTRYWKGNYAKLVDIKAKYDPKKVFAGPQLVGS
ncbi:hypothetical protein GQ44DRAFT_745576 [Phaeosphaeriaceae sp. PMI808]|nr:hypothetical protein GQ44DRAFT_745576 [Phaeosphaeriaceae sp. PMI808]